MTESLGEVKLASLSFDDWVEEVRSRVEGDQIYALAMITSKGVFVATVDTGLQNALGEAVGGVLENYAKRFVQ